MFRVVQCSVVTPPSLHFSVSVPSSSSLVDSAAVSRPRVGVGAPDHPQALLPTVQYTEENCVTAWGDIKHMGEGTIFRLEEKEKLVKNNQDNQIQSIGP